MLGLALGYATDLAHVAIPKTNETFFYTFEFFLNIAFPYTVIALAPYVVMVCGGRKEKSAWSSSKNILPNLFSIFSSVD